MTVVSRDRTERPAEGRYNICYVNAFQTQPGKLGWWKKRHPELLLRHNGKLVSDPNWPREVLLDTGTPAKRARLAEVVGRWIGGCAKAGFDAVEPDNLDSYSRARHEITKSDNLRFVALLAGVAHENGLAIAQKNLAGLSREKSARVGFDFAVAEDCQVYDECGDYRQVYGARVIEIEYADEGRMNLEKACAARGEKWSIVFRDRALRTAGHGRYRYDAC